MRIGPLELRRHATPNVALAADIPAAVHSKSVGASGTINIGGFLHQDDERNAELRSPELFRTLDRMHRTDPAVREAYLHTTVPVLNATWDIDPAGDDPDQLEQAEFIRQACFDWLDTPFLDTMQLALRYLRQGRQLFEVTEKVVTAELEYANPDATGPDDGVVTVAERQFVTWARWEHRRPETLWKWNTQDGVIESVEQHAFKDGKWGNWVMDPENLVLFVNEKEGDDFDGFSILRPAYKPWKLKDLVERVAAMSVEIHGIGVRVGYTPSDAKTDQAIVDAVVTQLENLQAGESNFIVFPGPKQSTSSTGGQPSDGYLLEVQAPPGGLPDFTPLLNYLRADIKGAVLARFSELGHGRTGARATSDSQSEVWYDALHAVSGYMTGVWNDPIKRLIDKNYPGVTKYPKLVARDIETKSLAEFAQANAQLMASGAINADRAYRAYVRKGIDAPDEDEPDEDDLDEVTEPEDDLPPAVPPDGPQAVEPALAAMFDRIREEIAAASVAAPETDAPHVTVNVHTPEGPAPTVTIENNIEPTPVTVNNQVDVAPTAVTVENTVEVSPTPVTVAPTVTPPTVTVTVEVPEQPAPVVTVQVPEEKPKRAIVERDSKGNMTSVEVRPAPEA